LNGLRSNALPASLVAELPEARLFAESVPIARPLIHSADGEENAGFWRFAALFKTNADRGRRRRRSEFVRMNRPAAGRLAVNKGFALRKCSTWPEHPIMLKIGLQLGL